MTAEIDILLEAVLERLMTDGRARTAVLNDMATTWPECRALTLIAALLRAADAIAETFNGEPEARADARAARQAALRLAELADGAALAQTGPQPLRLRDLAL